ncbi:M15 family metallopeptidase [Conexibacter sp. CPCC 206217]|uniref:M15 family metallopeptidase n=1 Tax=Conexibacter sp. CPCC 206217 TaxID=3064574 RepID=UPI002724B5CF|nr:M15 family metallopeptidase [Conexibacter sp. CPCC 206217]MDO8212966.1 M15 family metallopeptidase [Conexibacter sp. CPCC 206217]
MRTSRTLITLLVALALIAAPVAASTLGGDRARPERRVANVIAGSASLPVAAPGEVSATTPSRAAPAPLSALSPPLFTAPWATLVPPPLVSQRLDPVLARRNAARAALRRALAAARRDDAAVLVDKRRALPARYVPRDLVVPRVTFLAGVPEEGRMLRRRPARALERLFAAARRDKVPLAAVSGFRSYGSQQALFSGYASERGTENASHVSARAGHSEHQTGLAVDVSGANGRCAAESCFAGTRPARWLAAHVARYGFVVRYPRGREQTTGYEYEPWHLRYVGPALAATATRTDRTLDELLRRR